MSNVSCCRRRLWQLGRTPSPWRKAWPVLLVLLLPRLVLVPERLVVVVLLLPSLAVVVVVLLPSLAACGSAAAKPVVVAAKVAGAAAAKPVVGEAAAAVPPAGALRQVATQACHFQTTWKSNDPLVESQSVPGNFPAHLQPPSRPTSTERNLGSNQKVEVGNLGESQPS